MYKFSKISNERKNTCHPDLIAIVDELIKVFDISVICGHRDKRRQNEACDKGYSKIRWPHGKHNGFPSLAIDIYPYPIPKNLNKLSEEDIKRFGVMWGIFKGTANLFYQSGIITHHVRWGGDWDGDNRFNDQTFHDLGHCELLTF